MRQSYDHAQRKKSWVCTELARKDRALQEDRMRNLQEMEELKRFCCTEAETAKQLRIDELYFQEKESQSTVNQLTVQIQDLDKANSFNDNSEFYDPETASSSALSHVPSWPMSIPSPTAALACSL